MFKCLHDSRAVSPRQSNFELLRLIAMFMVLAVHANYNALGEPRLAGDPVNGLNAITRIFLEQATTICVNLFVFISGWFAIRPTGKKLVAFLFQVFFYSAIITVIAFLCGAEVRVRDVTKVFIIGSDYWFVVAYLVLFIFAPVLNQFIENASKRELEYFLAGFFVLTTFYGFFMQDIGAFNYGYSAIWLMGIYTLARYVRLWPNTFFQFSPQVDILIYVLCTTLSTVCSAIQIRMEITPVWVGPGYSYNNPFVVVASLYFFLAFAKLKFSSKCINWLASGAFAIYLIHCHGFVLPHFLSVAKGIYNKFSGLEYFLVILAFLLTVAILCILADKIRGLVCKKIQL